MCMSSGGSSKKKDTGPVSDPAVRTNAEELERYRAKYGTLEQPTVSLSGAKEPNLQGVTSLGGA